MTKRKSKHPPDFVPDDDFVDEHSKEDTGGPGGVVNYPVETWPEFFDPNAEYASPRADLVVGPEPAVPVAEDLPVVGEKPPGPVTSAKPSSRDKRTPPVVN